MKEKNHPDNYLSLLVLLLLVGAAWAVSTWWVQTHFGDWTDRGSFGDSFGAINALFSGLALAGIIYTIFLQKKELSLQREELEATREELKGQKEQLELQNQHWELQRIEDTYFKLHADLKSVIVKHGPENISSSTAIRLYCEDLSEILISPSGYHQKLGSYNKDSIIDIKHVLQNFFYNYRGSGLERYSRNFMFILEYLKPQKNTQSLLDHLLFTSSVYEKEIVFYYALWARSDDFMKTVLYFGIHDMITAVVPLEHLALVDDKYKEMRGGIEFFTPIDP